MPQFKGVGAISHPLSRALANEVYITDYRFVPFYVFYKDQRMFNEDNHEGNLGV